MAFFSEAFYSPQSPPASSLSPPVAGGASGPASRLDLDVEQTLDETIDFLSSSDIDKLLSSSPRAETPRKHRPLDTPPSSVVTHKLASSNPPQKRVDFAPFTSTNWGWAANAGPDAHKENTSSLLRKLQPSKERSSLRSKSILKPTSRRENGQDAFGSSSSSSSPNMAPSSSSWPQVLDAGLRQLRSEAPTTRLDAWRMMQQYLATAGPSVERSDELGEKHNAVLSIALTDLKHRDSQQSGGMPNQLPNYALKFLARLVQLPAELSSSLLNDLVRTTIEELQREDMSKNLRRCYMELLHQQNFGSDVMSSARVRKLVEAIHSSNKVQISSGILLDEIKVCRKFVDQAPEGMIASASSWLDILYLGVQSEELAVFRIAVDALFEVGLKLGHRIEVSRAFQKLLSAAVGEATELTQLQHLEAEMRRRADFALDTTQAGLIPKLLSAVLMLLRAKGPSTVLQSHTKSMLSVLRTYFQKSAVSTQSLAWTAWSWLIIAEMHGGRWPEETRAALRRPMEKLLMDSSVEYEFDKQTPSYVVSTYLVLLYCSFAPDSKPGEIKSKWDIYVADVLKSMVQSQSRSHVGLACDIVCRLLSSKTPWDPQMLLQLRKPWHSLILKVDDLPRIDAAWIRSNLDPVLRLLDRIFKSPQRAEYSVPVLKALLDALAHASANEVTTTREAKEAVARITTYLNHLWAPYSRKTKDTVLFGQLLDVLFQEPSTTPRSRIAIFAENILRKATHGDHFEVATTPSHRSNNTSPPTSTIAHFLDLATQELVGQHPRTELSQQPDDHATVLYNLIKQLAFHVYASQPTLVGKIATLCNNIRRLIRKKKDSEGSHVHAYIDTLCQDGLSEIEHLVIGAKTDGHNASEPLERAYELLTNTMSDIACYSTGVSNQLTACYRAVLDRARSELGVAGSLISVVEACARGVLHRLNDERDIKVQHNTLLDFAATILETTPVAVPSLEIRKAIERFGGGRYPSGKKKADHHEVYQMVDHVLRIVYEHVAGETATVKSIIHLINALIQALRKQRTSAINLIKVMQVGIAIFVRDKHGKIFGTNAVNLPSGAFIELWTTICITIFEHNDQKTLTTFDDLIAAGLTSRSSRIANETVNAWNEFFGLQADLNYPAKTAKALRQLTAIDVDLQLASALPQADEETPDSPLIIESIESVSETESVLAPPTPKPVSQLSRPSTSPMPAALRARRVTSTTPRGKPKPRHEDSQIQFEPIPSSPLPQPDPSTLTERQKEVAERQRHGEGALFANISSPAPPNRTRHVSVDLPDEDEIIPTPSTPVLAANMDDAIPSSSPVVASVKRRERSARRLPPAGVEFNNTLATSQDDLPSSPPALIEETLVTRLHSSATPSLRNDNAEHLRRKRDNLIMGLRKLQSIQNRPLESLSTTTISTVEDAPSLMKQTHSQHGEIEHSIPSTAPEDTESSNSIRGHTIKLTESNETRVEDSFIGPDTEESRDANHKNVSVEQSFDDSQDISQREASSPMDSQPRKRKRGRTALSSTKRRRTSDSFAYNTTDIIRFKPKGKLQAIDEMLPTIRVRIPCENESEPSYPDEGTTSEEQLIHSSNTTRPGRTRRSKPQEALEQESKVRTGSRKRGRSSARSQGFDNDYDANTKRTKTSPRTPTSRSRSASVHYVEVTPGDAEGRENSISTRTDTPKAETIISRSQNKALGESKDGVISRNHAGLAGPAANRSSTHVEHIPPVETDATVSEQVNEGTKTQVDEPLEGEVSARIPGDEHFPSASPTRANSPVPSVATSLASSQASQSSQMSSFSVSAFKDVMSRFVEQIKDFVNGGRRLATEEAAQRMAEEATRTVEKLARRAERNRLDYPAQ
ncbi:uncharacterized protein PV09_09004 [Verruconis gallopava]|uniref:Telomere-associated protein Rif1 N-terminal domain-containing protein n=1 Tax=Verruconis gallopava TaxID=253628 RepID=A0A0D1YF17_9PEZI|nr:uncharacterized protein PV09_09004 [Verruconis gallopava]KIV99346.1 hypothetical protein PV09_09004 [Verruconis gallopava]